MEPESEMVALWKAYLERLHEMASRPNPDLMKLAEAQRQECYRLVEAIPLPSESKG